MHGAKIPDLSRVAQDLQIRKNQVESVVELLDEGNTVPFIARYRKERTGGLTEDQVRQVQSRITRLRHFHDRKQTVLRSVEGQGKLTDDLRAAILAAEHPRRLDDLYLPYKPKRRSTASEARERGLEPLAEAIRMGDPAVANLAEVIPSMVDPEKGLATAEDVRAGVRKILAEAVAESADVRGAVRAVLWDTGKLLTSKAEALPEGKGLEYKDYFQFTEPLRNIPPHRILALNRGEKEGALQVRLEFDVEAIRRAVFEGDGKRAPALPLEGRPHAELLREAAEEGLKAVLLPSLEREVRRELTDEAQAHAVSIFARNVRSMLLQPPLRGRRVLAIHPGFRTGCKVAALDENGGLLEHALVFPHPPRKKRDEAKTKLTDLVRRHQTSVVAIGSGPACRETEELVSELIASLSGAPPSDDAAPVPLPAANVTDASSAQPAALPSPAPEVAADVPPPSPTPLASGPSESGALGPLDAGGAPVPVGEHRSDLVMSSDPPPATVEPATAPAGTVETAPHVGPPPSLTDPAGSLPPPPPDLAYAVVNESGLNVYAGGPAGREEFPDYDAMLRSAISLGRRLQDPLRELVKVEPQYIGVGLYPHDVDTRHLRESLEAVVESAVNWVGVELNSSSLPLLRHVSGLNLLAARALAEHRAQHGPFRTREQLLPLAVIGPARFTQAAGFLTVAGGDEPLDRTRVHPESYAIARQILSELGYGTDVLTDPARGEELRNRLRSVRLEETAPRLGVGIPTLRDILDALGQAGHDPRDELPKPMLRRSILRLEDLQEGAELRGTVQNVVDFGAFVDVGLKDSGLVHISQMANRYVKSPHDVAAVGDVVTVWVLKVDSQRRRVSLTMIKPGTERKPLERRARDRRPQETQVPRSERPGGTPRGRRPEQRRRPPVPATARSAPPSAGTQPPAPAPGRTPPERPTPRKPPRPRPKLSQEALEGEAPLRTFGELKAFFDAKRREEPRPSTPQVSGEVPAQDPPTVLKPTEEPAVPPP